MVTSNGGPAPRESWPPRSTDRSPWARRDPRRGAHGPGLLRRFDLGALSALDTLGGKGQDPNRQSRAGPTPAPPVHRRTGTVALASRAPPLLSL